MDPLRLGLIYNIYIYIYYTYCMWNIYKDLTRPHYYKRWFSRGPKFPKLPKRQAGEISSFDLVLRKTPVSATSSVTKKYGSNSKQSWPTSHPFPLPPPHFLYESGCTCFPSCGMHITQIGPSPSVNSILFCRLLAGARCVPFVGKLGAVTPQGWELLKNQIIWITTHEDKILQISQMPKMLSFG